MQIIYLSFPFDFKVGLLLMSSVYIQGSVTCVSYTGTLTLKKADILPF